MSNSTATATKNSLPDLPGYMAAQMPACFRECLTSQFLKEGSQVSMGNIQVMMKEKRNITAEGMAADGLMTQAMQENRENGVTGRCRPNGKSSSSVSSRVS